MATSGTHAKAATEAGAAEGGDAAAPSDASVSGDARKEAEEFDNETETSGPKDLADGSSHEHEGETHEDD